MNITRSKFLGDLADECERSRLEYSKGRASGIRDVLADLREVETALAAAKAEGEERAKQLAELRAEGVSALAAMTAERDALKADVSMRSREVFRESQLRRKIEEMMKEHAEYLRENRLLDDQARAAVEGER